MEVEQDKQGINHSKDYILSMVSTVRLPAKSSSVFTRVDVRVSRLWLEV